MYELIYTGLAKKMMTFKYLILIVYFREEYWLCNAHQTQYYNISVCVNMFPTNIK